MSVVNAQFWRKLRPVDDPATGNRNVSLDELKRVVDEARIELARADTELSAAEQRRALALARFTNARDEFLACIEELDLFPPGVPGYTSERPK